MITFLSFFQPWKPETLWASIPSEAALADPGSTLQLESLKKYGVKNACSVCFFFCRNFRPGNQTHPAAKTVSVSRSLEFNVSPKVLTNSGEKQDIEMLEWNTCSGWLHYHIWSIATALKELQCSLKCKCQWSSRLLEGRPGLNVCHLFPAEKTQVLSWVPWYSNEPLVLRLHKAQLKSYILHNEGQFLCSRTKPCCWVKTQEKYKWM